MIYKNRLIFWLAGILLISGIILFSVDGALPFKDALLVFPGILIGVITGINMIRRRPINRLEVAAVVFFCLGVATWMGFVFSEKTIDDQGILHEPFFLIPLGSLLLLISTTLGIISLICRYINIRSKNKIAGTKIN